MILPDVTQQLLQAGSAGSLADAAAFLRRRVCPDGAVDRRDGDFDLAERQWADLLEWADAQGKILPLGWPAPDREGGRDALVAVWRKNATGASRLQRMASIHQDFGRAGAADCTA